MDSLVLRTDREPGIVILQLNREEAANALSTALLEAFIGHVEELHNSDARVVIVTGSGEKAFCAGADLKERRGIPEAQVRFAVDRIRRAVEGVATLPMPVIAAVNGVAFGGGTEIALAADIRILSEHAKMGLTETSLAIIPGAGGTQRLARLVGVGKAKELIYTARRIDAQSALAIGLANAVVAPSELIPAAIAMAEEIAANGPLAVRQAKLALDGGMDVALPSGLLLERAAYDTLIPTQDRLEGLLAFAEKRRPNYQGR
ncbi:enoyl-CoA hydratase-related protein [Alicyclobacillus fastidiosus]|uniref:Enoyl-CoA hydratase-related protein n=1 Tax=Alicyclobacillus fastidiosus TaxID=392011 RepID=A0ABV5AC65_9BACL|nr:enoyl-CoA hydratase-related protein [Alicyclobacillus fastidiosus]WEH11432.1 enoyl-CoA hydratase-related protein [Alicyclobacillus fastidiosus]